jgi:hypothetical protein
MRLFCWLFPLKSFPTFGLAILPPGCPAVGASEELRGRLVCTSRLDQPIKGFVIIALRTVGLCLGKGADLLLLPAQNDYALPFMREPADHLVASATCVPTLYTGHEDFLLLLRGKKCGTTLWAKLQKLVSRSGGGPANLSFILWGSSLHF